MPANTEPTGNLEPSIEKGSDALVESLLAHGIDTLFALPGAQIDHLFASLHDRADRIRTVTSRHEQGAAYMAFGYARSTGSPAVYSVVPGPGWLNASAALLTAYGCYTPVMSLSGQIPLASIGRDFGELHEVPDQLALAKGLTKWAARIEDPDNAGALMAQALSTMQSGLKRPVHLETPPDVMGAPTKSGLVPPLPIEPSPVPEDKDIEQAAKLLAEAAQPMIFVGGGAQHCGNAVTKLGEILQAPVIAFRAGRGVIDERHFLSQPWPSAHRLWAETDVVLAIGTRLDFPLRMWGTDSAMKIMWIDLDPERPSKVVDPALALEGDASAVTRRLLDAVSATRVSRASRKTEFEERKASAIAEFDDNIGPQMAFLRAIRNALPEEGIFVDELTQIGYGSWVWFPTYSPRQFITSGYQGNLGYGFPTALGVKVAHCDRAVVSVCGDGGFQFGASELATAVKHDIGLVTIVFNDGWYGNVKRIQKERYANRIYCSDLTNPDYQLLAKSYGIFSECVESADDLEAALGRAFASHGPALIEVRVGDLPTPWSTIVRPKNRGT